MYIEKEYNSVKKMLKLSYILKINNLGKNNKNNVIIEYKLGKIQTQF